jgi:hypothetical protein
MVTMDKCDRCGVCPSEVHCGRDERTLCDICEGCIMNEGRCLLQETAASEEGEDTNNA